MTQVTQNFEIARHKAKEHKDSFVKLLWEYMPTVDPALAHIPYDPIYVLAPPARGASGAKGRRGRASRVIRGLRAHGPWRWWRGVAVWANARQ